MQRAKEMSDWLLKILMPIFIAICSFALQSVTTELKELRIEIQSMRAEYIAKVSQMAIEIATLQAKFDYHEGKRAN